MQQIFKFCHTENGNQSQPSQLSPPCKLLKFLQDRLSSAAPNLPNSGPVCDLETYLKTFNIFNTSIASRPMSSSHYQSQSADNNNESSEFGLLVETTFPDFTCWQKICWLLLLLRHIVRGSSILL